MILAFGKIRASFAIWLVCRDSSTSRSAHRQPAAADADDFVFDLPLQRALLLDGNRLLREQRDGHSSIARSSIDVVTAPAGSLASGERERGVRQQRDAGADARARRIPSRPSSRAG